MVATDTEPNSQIKKHLQAQYSLHILLINLPPKVVQYFFHYFTLMWLASLVASNAGDFGFNPGSGRSPGEGNSNPLQYFNLKNSTEEPGGQSVSGKELDVTDTFTFHPNV